jgi:hypothetical protein
VDSGLIKNNKMRYSFNNGYGQIIANQIAASVGPVMGRVHIVVEDSDPAVVKDTLQEIFVPDPDGHVRFFSTLNAAYDACTSNANDVILLTGHTTHTLTTGIDWSKSRIHVIGMDGGDRLVQQGAKVSSSSTDTTAYVIKVTGVRNSFRNIKFIQASTNAAALTVLQEGGEGNLYKNCSFVFGVVDNLDLTTAHEVLAGSDSATYLNCTFGSDTLLTSAARSVFHIDQVTTSQEFKSNILKECYFIISSSSSAATFVRLDAVEDILFTNIFDRCVFVASVDTAGGAAIAEASQTGTGTNKGVLVYNYCSVFNVTDFSTATSGRNAATQVVAAVPTAGTAGIGVAPTA